MSAKKTTDPEGRMTLREHLVELRRRLFRAAAGLLVGAVAGWFASAFVMDLLFAPILQVAAERHHEIAPNFSGVASAFDMKIRVSLFLGVFLSSPWWIYQLWAFVTPGLTRRERRVSIGFVAAAVPLFLAGAALAWWVIPNAIRLLTLATPKGAVNLIDAQTYLSFVMQMVLAFGLTFLLPLFMVALTMAGLVRGGTWLKGWRWAVVLSFTFAAVVTPTPDVITMFLVALPTLVLYFGAVGLGVLHDHRVDRRRAAEGLLPAADPG